MWKQTYEQALHHLPQGVRWAEANIKRTASTIVTVQNGDFASAAAENADAIYVRAAKAGVGVAYSQDLYADPAALMAQAAENGMLFDAEAPETLIASGVQHSAKPLPPAEDARALGEIGTAACRAAIAADSRVVSAICEMREDTHTHYVLNSCGTNSETAMRVYTCELALTLEADGRQVNASALATASTPYALALPECVADAISKANEQLLPKMDVPAGSYPAVLDHSVMNNILITSWQLFSAAKYLGNASALSGLLGETVASGCVTIVDRANHPACGYAYPADDEATAAPEQTLVQNGVLQGLLHTRQTAQQMNVAATGNAGRVALLTGSIPTALIPLPRILTVEPGAKSRDELLCDLGDGLFIPFSFDIFHSINIASGDFSIPCRAIVVKGGKMVGQCGDLTMTGNLKTLLSSIAELGRDVHIRPFLLRSYCYGAPSARLAKLQIG